MRLALAQMNTVVGDLDGNAGADPRPPRSRLSAAQRRPRARSPSSPLTGYPPEDLLLRPGFIRAAARPLAELARRGRRQRRAGRALPTSTSDLYNACFVLADGAVRGVYRKRFLPNYGVFDENRYFASGRELLLLRFGEVLVGPTICEDIWQPGPPATELALAGAQLLVNISASPFHVGKGREREEMIRVRARDNACFVALCNAVGGQDELVFDGGSVVFDDEGELVARAPSFEEALLVVDLDPTATVGRRLRDLRRRALAPRASSARRVAELAFPAPRAAGTSRCAPTPRRRSTSSSRCAAALELGLRDYVDKNGFGDGRGRRLRRDRLRADRRRLRRGARRRARPRRLDAVALLVAGDARRRGAAGRVARDRLPRDRDRADGRRVRRGARAVVRRPRARPDRGEPAGARSAARC